MAKLKKLIQGGDFTVGEDVLVGTTQEEGIIRFTGNTQFSPGEWVGVELLQPLGKNDGSVKGFYYFQCKPKHGIFVRRTALLRPKQAEEVVKGPSGPKTKAGKAVASGIRSGEINKMADNKEDNKEEQIVPATPPSAKKETSRERSSSKPSKGEKATRSPSKRSNELDEQAAAALKDLREAVEDHNPEVLRRALAVAESKGVPPEELHSAHRVLAFESQKALCKEMDKVRHVVAGLAEVARQTQEKAKAAEENARNSSWISNLVKRIEGSVWESLEKKVEERIESVARAVAQEMLSKAPLAVGGTRNQVPGSQNAKDALAATKLQSAWRRRIARQVVDSNTRCFNTIATVARKRNVAWSAIFDETCAKCNRDALYSNDFHRAMCEIHPKLSQGQTNILFGGYTRGCDRNDVDLVGFLGMCEAVASGDEKAAEFADVSVEVYQSLGSADASAAALKIQCAQRQKAARAEVNSRAQAKREMAPKDPPEAKVIKDSDKTQRVANLRAQAKQGLSEASKDGSLGKVLQQKSRQSQAQPEVSERKWQYSKEQAAVMLQRWIRRRLAGIKDDPMAVAVKKVKLRHQAWCAAYDAASSGGSGLDEDRFSRAIESAIPDRLSAAQKHVVYQGYLEGTGKESMDLVGFCAVASAVATGDQAVAEYADMDLPVFQVLGQKGADEAASKIGAVVRGRQTRIRQQGGG